MADRMRFILDGDDRLSRILNHAGDSSERLYRRLADTSRRGSAAMRSMADDAGTRLRSLRDRFTSTGDSADSMGSRVVAAARRLLSVGDASTRAQQGITRLSGGLPDVTRRLDGVASSGGGAAASLGGSGGGLSGAMLGVGAAAGLSLLPALGAVVPMLAGGALAAGTLKLGFAGVGDAMEAAGKGKKEYGEALKKLGPEQRDFTKALVDTKKEFSGVGRDVQKAMLPSFTRAVKDAAPVVRILGRSAVELGKGFGDAAKGVGRLLKDSGFQKDLQTNLKLGSGFIRDMTSSLGPFTRSLLDFGAASGPTLRAFSDGIGGLLSKGLPSMFDGLTVGIPGTAKMLDGLFSLINDVVGGIGRLGGQAGRVLGPLFGETFKVGGDIAAGAMDALAGALDKLEPVFRDVTYGLKTVRDVGAIVGPTLKDTALGIAGAFLPIGDSVENAVGPLQRLNRWVAENRVGILEASRVFGVAMIDLTGAAINAAPTVIHAFRFISKAFMDSVSVVVGGAAKLFGWLPGVGPKLKKASKEFDDFKGNYLDGLNAAEAKATEFAASSAPKLSAGKLQLNINNWQSQIEAAKAKLKTVPPGKQAALKATIADLEAKVRRAKGQLASVTDKTVHITSVFTTVGSKSAVAPSHRNYATGGTPAKGELAMVGEEGPELVVFGQDARVFTANETKGILHGSVGARTIGAGKAAGQGLVAGMSASTGSVGAAARLMAAAVTAGIRAEMQIASPSKKTKALAADIGRGLIAGLTGSQAKIKSVSADLAKDIKTAFSGRKESSLVKMVDRQTDKLLAVAKKRDALAAKIAEAKKYAGDLTSSAREGAGLANLGLEDGGINAGTIKAGLAGKLSKIKQFTDYITILAKRGLSKGLLRQVLNMGPEAGYAYASALVGADKATFKSINSIQGQLDKSTATLGRVGADKLYDSGKNASKGFLAGLTSQEKQLEAVMVKIAKSMQKALRRALGIKSPARAMIPDGVNTARGVAVGVLQGLPHVDRAMQAVAGRMAGRAAVAPVVGRPATVGSGGVVYNVKIDVHDPMDPVAVGLQMQRVFLELGRHQGATVVLSPGR